ncbi:glycerophosphoryl diester phosphodiesterase membrane domain-containing protein [Agromyces lapidis]|uniref:Glycerophosphoryl diester phosphodiesterase membrane domain-containing protein n=1 Tax=Agromyces lapidis TaxID=279574 RepID=A0ABV5SR54_9MICO|nr:glycerophosphoryl diester phosphodiesterase membrane domain-containing protein [Agromyces lapidis]
MSDHDWQAPGTPASGSAPDAPVPPPYGAPPVPPAPGYGSPQQPWLPPAPGAWAPPPKPGLLPLRPLSFGTLLWAPFQALRRNPGATFGSGLVVQLVSAFATLAVVVPFMVFIFTRVENAASEDMDAVMSGGVGAFLLLMLVPVALTLVAGAFLQGVMVVEVATGTLGERLGFGALWRRAARRIWPLLGWTALVTLAVLLVVAVFTGIIVVAALTSPGALIGAVLVTLFGALGLAVVGAWLGTKLAIVPSIIVLENTGIGQAVRRSWRLTNGYFWRTFGTLLLVGLILNVAAQVVVQPVSLIGTVLAAIIDPTGTGAALGITIATSVVTLVLSLLIGAITAVVQAALVAVIYIDLRMRTEGLDLELARHVEQRDAGAAATGDPYAPPPSSAPAPAWAPYAPAAAPPATTWPTTPEAGGPEQPRH